jgi:hypothetical protein
MLHFLFNEDAVLSLFTKQFSIIAARSYFMYLNCKTYFSYAYGTFGTE